MSTSTPRNPPPADPSPAGTHDGRVEPADLGNEYERLTLLEALEQWCTPTLVQAVRTEEMRHSDFTLTQFPQVKLTPRSDWRSSARGIWLDAKDYTGLRTAWFDLERDFRSKLEIGELHLEGILFGKDLEREPEAIRGAFAAKMDFDYERNTLRLAGKEYVAIQVSRHPSPWAPLELRSQPTERTPSVFRVEDLTAEQIVQLIEEHYRRVVADPDTKLLPKGKVSLMPLIQMKLRDRAAKSEMLGSIADEAAWLEGWIRESAPNHVTPTASSIQRSLGKTYAGLMGGSKAGIK